MVHQEEMILPKPISRGFQELFANGAASAEDDLAGNGFGHVHISWWVTAA
jgi:hypothetical protein